jgi:leucyl-tRNA synthetase
MPGYAGSSWYFLRYMDPHNQQEFAGRQATDYWNQVDLYIGGTEHAVGHLLYSRLWTKILFDLGHIGFDEPFRKLVNQGMIQGSSRFVYRLSPLFFNDPAMVTPNPPQIFLSKGAVDKLAIKNSHFKNEVIEAIVEILKYLYDKPEITHRQIVETTALHVDVNIVEGLELDVNAFRNWKPEFENASFVFEDVSFSTKDFTVGNDGKFICGAEVEKMSKSKFNTVNPDDLVAKFGADTFRMYEMFLGPVEQS